MCSTTRFQSNSNHEESSQGTVHGQGAFLCCLIQVGSNKLMIKGTSLHALYITSCITYSQVLRQNHILWRVVSEDLLFVSLYLDLIQRVEHPQQSTESIVANPIACFDEHVYKVNHTRIWVSFWVLMSDQQAASPTYRIDTSFEQSCSKISSFIFIELCPQNQNVSQIQPTTGNLYIVHLCPG